MCVYCATGDEFFKDQHPPIWPWNPAPPPFVPLPSPLPEPGYQGWDVDKLKELLDVLERIKKLEDSLGCPCEASKADYLNLIKAKIAQIEAETEVCPDCKRRYRKPGFNHSRVQCLKMQLVDAEAEEKEKVV